MKTIFLLICANLVFVGTSIADPPDYDTVKRAKLVEWVEQLRIAANSAKAHAEEADQKLVESQATVEQTNGENKKLQGDIDKLTQWGIEQQGIAIRAQQDLDHVLKKLHLWKWFGSIGLALLVFLIIWKWSPPLTTPYAVAIYIVPPLLAFGAVWTFL